MKTLLPIWCVLFALAQNALAAPAGAPKAKPAGAPKAKHAGAPKEKQKKPAPLADVENETKEDRSNYLVDLMEKAIDSKDELAMFGLKEPVLFPSGKKHIKKKHKHNKKPKDAKHQNDVKQQKGANQQKDAKKQNDVKPQKLVKQQNVETKQQEKKKTKRRKLLNFLRRNSTSSMEDDIQKRLLLNQNLNQVGNGIQIGGSEEDETLEDLGGRKAESKKQFEDVYRYENEPLSKMLLWLVMNSQNPSAKNVIEASKTAVDKYVKYTVDKASAQAALRHTDYSSLRFDKDKILIYCGGQLYVYNTMQDSKICFNGQISEVRLV